MRSTQYLDCPMCGRAAIPEMSRRLCEEGDPDPSFECGMEIECPGCGAELRVDDNEECVGVEVYDEETMTYRSALEVM